GNRATPNCATSSRRRCRFSGLYASGGHPSKCAGTFTEGHVRRKSEHPPRGDDGFQVTEVRCGEAVVEMEAGPQHANPSGTLHGGVLCTIADSAMGIAHASMLNAEESFTTLELKINFLRPFWTGKLRAIGKVVKSGKTISLVE